MSLQQVNATLFLKVLRLWNQSYSARFQDQCRKPRFIDLHCLSIFHYKETVISEKFIFGATLKRNLLLTTYHENHSSVP
jgi:hypothetical protein